VCLLALEIQFWIDPIRKFHLDAMLYELNIDSLAHVLSLIRAWFIDGIASMCCLEVFRSVELALARFDLATRVSQQRVLRFLCDVEAQQQRCIRHGLGDG
jgi:hypothetical protein